MKKIVLFFVATLFSACATKPSTKMPQSFSSESNLGMIVGTIAIKNEKPIFNHYTYFYVGENLRHAIIIKPEQTIKMKFQPDFSDNDKAVYFFTITEAPGNYKFSFLDLFANGGFINSSTEIPMDISFKVEKGKVKYLGEIYFSYKDQIMQLNNKKDRDLQKLKESFPNLNVE